jgi:arsenate reductase
MENTKKVKILFLCTGNSCRSQIAEGFTRQLKKAEIEVRPAGIEPKGIDPRAIKIMAEVGIDISNQGSKSIDEIKDIEFDYVITLCDNAQKTCPSFPAKTSIIHVGFEDPPSLAENARDEEEAMQHYRRVRNQIKTFVEQLPDILTNKKPDIEFDPRQLLSGISTDRNQQSED